MHLPYHTTPPPTFCSSLMSSGWARDPASDCPGPPRSGWSILQATVVWHHLESHTCPNDPSPMIFSSSSSL